MMAMERICGYCINSIVEEYTLRDEAKLTTVSTSLCLAMALLTSWYTGSSVSLVPQYLKNNQ